MRTSVLSAIRACPRRGKLHSDGLASGATFEQIFHASSCKYDVPRSKLYHHKNTQFQIHTNSQDFSKFTSLYAPEVSIVHAVNSFQILNHARKRDALARYSTLIGATMESTCQECAAGSAPLPDASNCAQCTAGYFAEQGARRGLDPRRI